MRPRRKLDVLPSRKYCFDGASLISVRCPVHHRPNWRIIAISIVVAAKAIGAEMYYLEKTATLIVLVCAFWFAVFNLRRGGFSIRSLLSWRPIPLAESLIFVPVIVIASTSNALFWADGIHSEVEYRDVYQNLLAILIAWIIAPVAEEFLFRGQLLSFFFLRLKSITIPVLIVSILWSIGHAKINAVGIVIASCWLCSIRIRVGSLLPCIVLHSFHNVFAFVLAASIDASQQLTELLNQSLDLLLFFALILYITLCGWLFFVYRRMILLSREGGLLLWRNLSASHAGANEQARKTGE